MALRRGWFEEKDEIHSNRYICDSIDCYKYTRVFISLFSKLIDEFTVYDYKQYLKVYFLKTFKDLKGDKSGEGGIADVPNTKLLEKVSFI